MKTKLFLLALPFLALLTMAAPSARADWHGHDSRRGAYHGRYYHHGHYYAHRYRHSYWRGGHRYYYWDYYGPAYYPGGVSVNVNL